MGPPDPWGCTGVGIMFRWDPWGSTGASVRREPQDASATRSTGVCGHKMQLCLVPFVHPSFFTPHLSPSYERYYTRLLSRRCGGRLSFLGRPSPLLVRDALPKQQYPNSNIQPAISNQQYPNSNNPTSMGSHPEKCRRGGREGRGLGCGVREMGDGRWDLG